MIHDDYAEHKSMGSGVRCCRVVVGVVVGVWHSRHLIALSFQSFLASFKFLQINLFIFKGFRG